MALKQLFSGFRVAFSLYSVIPMPKTDWTKDTMKYALCFLPLVGVIVGGLSYIWLYAAQKLALEPLLYAVIATLLPMLVTGGIHLDGFTDTSDALCSYGDREKRLEILKDPHVGAFGVMYLIALLLLHAGLYTQLLRTPRFILLLAVGFAFARIIGGTAIVWLPCAKNSGLVHTFAKGCDRKQVRVIFVFELLLCLWLMLVISPLCTAVLCVVLAVLFPLYRLFCLSVFGGITGDLAGFGITLTETLVLIVCVVCGLAV